MSGPLDIKSATFRSIPASSGSGDIYPWVQVDMGVQKVVKSVQFYRWVLTMKHKDAQAAHTVLV